MTRTTLDTTGSRTALRWLRRTLAATTLLALAAPAHAVCSFGNGAETTLQQAFDTRFGAGSAPDAVNDCVAEGSDASWQFTANPSTTNIVLEFSSFSGNNSFGLYDPTNPTGPRLAVFHPTSSAGATRTITITQLVDGRFYFESENQFGEVSNATFNTASFGFQIGTPEDGGTRHYSDSSLNFNGLDHMYAYQGGGQTFLNGPPSIAGTLFTADDYILAWEEKKDLGAMDYQDMVIVVRNVTPVPLPPAAWLLGSGLIALAGIARRRRPRVVGKGATEVPLPA